jgi:hypothetical protein
MTAVVFILLACAAWFAIGLVAGISWCSRKHQCIRHQRREVARWEKDITGEITKDMQARLARRAAMDAALKDSGTHAAIPERRPSQDRDRDGHT